MSLPIPTFILDLEESVSYNSIEDEEPQGEIELFNPVVIY
jgi:hypothetical protein